MDDFRIKKLEFNVAEHNRRLSDHDELHKETRKDIDMLKAIHEAQQETNQLISEIAGYAQKTYEVFEPMAKFVSFAAKVALLGTFVWHAVKVVMAKLSIVFP